ncbi:MAG: hypothetical protein JSV91_05370 [Phycisphaerales bacterium]|nr:MAG: hypothetical protein JSV91_05370 [Phycisphaerales bacterium]
MPSPSTPNPRRVFERLIDIREGESRIILWSCAYFFFLLAGYYVLRPVREAMGLTGGVRNLPWLYMATLGSMLIVNPIFAALVSRYSRRIFVPTVYVFLGVNLAVFFVLFRSLPESGTVGPARVFYVWLSVINLFINSLFWSTMADIFRPGQSKRLFGLIGVGGTTGAIVGAATAVFVADHIAKLHEQTGAAGAVRVEDVLLPVAFGLWLIACLCAMQVDRVARVVKWMKASSVDEPYDDFADPALGGHMWAGITHVIRSPYLLGICLFLLFYTLSSTITYFIQANIVDAAFESREQRTAVFGWIDLSVNILTLLIQVFLTGRIIRKIGVGVTLGLLPLVSLIGFVALGLYPILVVLIVFQVCRRGSNYALSKPARETLFTVIPREDKYKAKNLIDMFFYRGGDAIGAAGFKALTEPAAIFNGLSGAAAGLGLAEPAAALKAMALSVVGLGLGGVASLAAPMAVVWFIVAVILGRAQSKRATLMAQTPGASPPTPEPADRATLPH